MFERMQFVTKYGDEKNNDKLIKLAHAGDEDAFKECIMRSSLSGQTGNPNPIDVDSVNSIAHSLLKTTPDHLLAIYINAAYGYLSRMSLPESYNKLLSLLRTRDVEMRKYASYILAYEDAPDSVTAYTMAVYGVISGGTQSRRNYLDRVQPRQNNWAKNETNDKLISLIQFVLLRYCGVKFDRNEFEQSMFLRAFSADEFAELTTQLRESNYSSVPVESIIKSDSALHRILTKTVQDDYQLVVEYFAKARALSIISELQYLDMLMSVFKMLHAQGRVDDAITVLDRLNKIKGCRGYDNTIFAVYAKADPGRMNFKYFQIMREALYKVYRHGIASNVCGDHVDFGNLLEQEFIEKAIKIYTSEFDSIHDELRAMFSDAFRQVYLYQADRNQRKSIDSTRMWSGEEQRDLFYKSIDSIMAMLPHAQDMNDWKNLHANVLAAIEKLRSTLPFRLFSTAVDKMMNDLVGALKVINFKITVKAERPFKKKESTYLGLMKEIEQKRVSSSHDALPVEQSIDSVTVSLEPEVQPVAMIPDAPLMTTVPLYPIGTFDPATQQIVFFNPAPIPSLVVQPPVFMSSQQFVYQQPVMLPSNPFAVPAEFNTNSISTNQATVDDLLGLGSVQPEDEFADQFPSVPTHPVVPVSDWSIFAPPASQVCSSSSQQQQKIAILNP